MDFIENNEVPTLLQNFVSELALSKTCVQNFSLITIRLADTYFPNKTNLD